MSFSATGLLFASLLYLMLLFGVAWITERGSIPRHWVRHPLVYTLSLGVYAGIWAVYAAVGVAAESGYGFLAYYLGISGAFLLAPVLLSPILRIGRAYQLTSLADLFAYRYRSQWAGTLVTLCSGGAILSLLSMQIQAVTTSASILAPDTSPNLISVMFSLTVVLFAMLFGARRDHHSQNHQGLVLAIAFDSLVKLVALLVLGGVILFGVFGGMEGLDSWLAKNNTPARTMTLNIDDGSWRALMLMSFAAALVLPHMYHMIFAENPSPKALAKASWGLPLYLLLLSIPVPLILWGGQELGVTTGANFYSLGTAQALGSPALTLLMYIAGLSAASGLMIVSTLALAGMVLNHVVLPLKTPREQGDIYRWLQWIKRLLIAVIIFLALLFHETVGSNLDLSILGAISLSGMLHLLPGALGVIYWPEGNRRGLIAGLIIGLGIWIATIVLPFSHTINLLEILGAPLVPDYSNWHIFTFAGLTANVMTFALISIVSGTTNEEASAAQACSLGALSRPQRRELLAASSNEFVKHLSEPLGYGVARREVDRALTQLKLPNVEYRPYQLRRLRDQVEINLSGLLGPSVARDMVKRHLGFKPLARGGAAQDIRYVERALGDYQNRLTGLAGELDNLRRHYRQTLQNLPIPACSVGEDGEILMWNNTMEALTGITADDVVGARLMALPEHWHLLLDDFNRGEELHRYKHRLDLRGKPHWLNLHKAALSGPDHPEGGSIILVEDQTETRLLEDELMHSERLASVGRLAAGVAHEIGNPVTGISSLAQNLKLETDNPDILDTADQIQQQTRRISTILQSLMNFARTGNHAHANRYEPVDIRRCVEESINLLSLSNKGHGIRFINDCPPELQILGDEQRLVQVFINLLANARDASPEGSTIQISGNGDGYSAIIEVTDEGSGIPEEQLDHIFEPFYTTKAPNKGTGLGLSLVYSIIEEHYGNIQVESPANAETGAGTRVRLRLPAYQAEPGTDTISQNQGL
ncbi:MAG: PAS domain S-box protein [Gammaproteobacteria bacterium]|uniref:histidine kinase n=1 Tax=Marinobacter nitratireducens TaxID=1137280 RepID=A0A072NB79_9GAMM|nr:ATP-binding protein [Marinobacter nitratireducens]KEF30320.1 Two-component sensor CbrA: intrcellular carbon:nitrogen balance [Marinobacter nitratireducens]TNE75763.1 MAG: PAS domain S-box protein [Gammaproteobacteria bacterium]